MSSNHFPTPDEIAERAAAIRATWDEATLHDRRVWHGHVEWSLPWIGIESVDVDQVNNDDRWL